MQYLQIILPTTTKMKQKSCITIGLWTSNFVKYLISLTLCNNCLTVSIKQCQIIQSYITAASIANRSFDDKLVKNSNDDYEKYDDNINDTSSDNSDNYSYDITQ